MAILAPLPPHLCTDGPILKPFEVISVITLMFCLLYNNVCEVMKYLCKYVTICEPILEPEISRKSVFYKASPSFRFYFTLEVF